MSWGYLVEGEFHYLATEISGTIETIFSKCENPCSSELNRIYEAGWTYHQLMDNGFRGAYIPLMVYSDFTGVVRSCQL